MSLNKLTTTDIRSNFNLGGGDIKCNELYTKNLKYNVFQKTKFTPTIFINDENNQIPLNRIVENNCYFYTTGSVLTFFGNIQLVTLPPSLLSGPSIYLTIPTDLESKIGSPQVCALGTYTGIIFNEFQNSFTSIYDSSISLTPLNSIPSLRLNFVREQTGDDLLGRVYYLTFECTFQLL